VDRNDPTGLINMNAGASLTSWGNGEWIGNSDGIDNQTLMENRAQREQNAGITIAQVSPMHEGAKNGVKVTGGFKDLDKMKDAAVRKDYDQIDKSGIGGKDRFEYGGYYLRRKDAQGDTEYGYSGPSKGKQGKVTDHYRKMREANYLVLYGPGALPTPQGWTKIGWHYAHVIPGNTIPDDDKAVARDYRYIVGGAAPPLRRGAYYNPNNPMIEYYP